MEERDATMEKGGGGRLISVATRLRMLSPFSPNPPTPSHSTHPPTHPLDPHMPKPCPRLLMPRLQRVG